MNVDKFRAQLLSCPASGSGLRKVNRWVFGKFHEAKTLGLDVETATRLIIASMSRPPHPGEIERAVERVYGVSESFSRPKPPKPRPAPIALRHWIEKGKDGSEEAIRRISPRSLDWDCARGLDGDGRQDAIALVQALFLPGEQVGCGAPRTWRKPNGEIVEWIDWGVNTREGWIDYWRLGFFIPPLICPNPLMPGGVLRSNGKRSFVCNDAIAVFRHVVAEMDGIPLQDQCKFWCGLGLKGITALIFSGNKSYHALLRVDAADRKEWNAKVVQGLYPLALVPLGFDPSCCNPCRATRLAGAWRVDKRVPQGARQYLVYANKELAA